MSFETSFDSKQPKLEPKLVSALSETQRLFRLFASIPKQRVSMFRLNRNKQKTNRNSLIGSIFCNFLQKIYGFFGFFVFFLVFPVFSFFFSVFSVWFQTVCFGVSVVYLLYRNREFRLIRNKQKTHPNSLKESIFVYFSENLGLFRFVSVCYKTVLLVSVVSI